MGKKSGKRHVKTLKIQKSVFLTYITFKLFFDFNIHKEPFTKVNGSFTVNIVIYVK